MNNRQPLFGCLSGVLFRRSLFCHDILRSHPLPYREWQALLHDKRPASVD